MQDINSNELTGKMNERKYSHNLRNSQTDGPSLSYL